MAQPYDCRTPEETRECLQTLISFDHMQIADIIRAVAKGENIQEWIKLADEFEAEYWGDSKPS